MYVCHSLTLKLMVYLGMRFERKDTLQSLQLINLNGAGAVCVSEISITVYREKHITLLVYEPDWVASCYDQLDQNNRYEHSQCTAYIH